MFIYVYTHMYICMNIHVYRLIDVCVFLREHGLLIVTCFRYSSHAVVTEPYPIGASFLVIITVGYARDSETTREGVVAKIRGR